MKTIEPNDAAPVEMWLASPLDEAVRRAIERVRNADDVMRVAVMPDVHLANDVCVGTVIATRRLVYPSAVGGDIGCGMLAIQFDLESSVLRDPQRAGRLLRLLQERIPVHRRNRHHVAVWPADLSSRDLSVNQLRRFADDEGAVQMGTLGGGNHFVELQEDQAGQLWLMIHSGSRAMGQAIRAHHISRATIRSGSMMALDAGLEEGEAYLNDMSWGRRYADANRAAMGEAVIDAVRQVAGAGFIRETQIAVDHNHVARESHFGQTVLVHRKGAMPAPQGAAGVVPGSMGTLSYHVQGLGCPASLCSSAHGAGRLYSRHAARERFARQDLRRQMHGVWFDPRLLDDLRDESPKSYKDVGSVMRAQSDLVSVTRTLQPLLVHKGGGKA